MKAIIFGACGQDGYYLTALLENKQIEVIGIARKGTEIIGDVSDFNFVESQIKYHKPEYIFHLAANSTTSHNALFANHKAISTGTLNILESTRVHCSGAKVFLSGSAMQFVNKGKPIDEQSPFEGSSPYSIARIQSLYAARYYRKTFGLKVYFGYFFNHDSPSRADRHVNQKIAQAVIRISRGAYEKIELDNIEVQKEFNYAGDVIEAVWILVNQSIVYEAVIGCGKAYSIKEWLEYCFNRVNLNWNDFVTIKKGFKPEYQILVSNPKLIMSIGWKPKVDFYQLADMMLNIY